MKASSLILLVVCLLFCLSVPINGQSGTFTVYLPKIGYPPPEEGQGWNGNQPKVWGAYDGVAHDDSIVVPNGRPIYALIVSGYAQNGNLDELLVYKFARVLMDHGAYVHYAWWNNLLAPYMERPLHYDQSYPGNLGQDIQNFTTVEQANEKALPGEDYQFVEDAKLFLSAIRQHNPDAMIIVVGHSMGGGAIVHLASPWNTDESIDILAPIDPVGNRNYPWAGIGQANDYHFNWTRWRVTRDRFLGYKAEEYSLLNGCISTGSWLAKYDVARDLTPLVCRPPTIHQASALTFGSNIVHLYHRWQREAVFPFDFLQNYTFGHNRPPGGSTFQEYVPTTHRMCGLQRCQDPGGWPEGNDSSKACCPTGDGVGWQVDGHGEIVGYRGPLPPVPLGIRVSTSPDCGSNCPGKIWPWRYKIGNIWMNDSSASRVEIFKELENLPAGSTWEHRPTNPDLCLVSDGLISLFNSTNYTISQWTQQPSGTSKQIRSVFFTDANNGWVVGNTGLIKHTTDGGNTWPFLQPSGTTKNITDVYFTDANTGWVVGSDGLIKHTTDGGTTWPFLQPSGTSRLLTASYFTDANTGWVVGDVGLIKHTTDGGNTWPFLQTSGTNERLTDVHFTDASNGWAVGYGGVITHTTDGGNTWTLQPSGTSKNITAVYFIDASTGWVVGFDGLIKHTTNGGNNWTLQLPGTSRDLTDFHFTDASTGWVVGYGGLITHTTDGGTTWNLQVTGRLNNIESVYFTDANTGWAVGSEGLILHTNNGGVLSVEEKKIYEMPSDYNLSQNYPNPFNPSTKIRYSVPQSSNVVIKVFDILGSEVETLVNEERPAGTYELNWNAADLPSGIYFYRLLADNFVKTKKMVLLK